MRRAHPGSRFDFINVGLPSETASGLSEPDHPYPRPTVHERLDRILAKTKPDVVFACYGMNDGIYYPFSKERFKKYDEGLNVLIDKVKKAGGLVAEVARLWRMAAVTRPNSGEFGYAAFGYAALVCCRFFQPEGNSPISESRWR